MPPPYNFRLTTYATASASVKLIQVQDQTNLDLWRIYVQSITLFSTLSTANRSFQVRVKQNTPAPAGYDSSTAATYAPIATATGVTYTAAMNVANGSTDGAYAYSYPNAANSYALNTPGSYLVGIQTVQ